METEQLKLENQICFPVYAASRLIIRQYQPYLEELGITYPQYLVLLVLWEEDGIPINDIAHTLILNTNTVTPLLKRMEENGLIKRSKSKEDQRKFLISLTDKGQKLKQKATHIPESLAEDLGNTKEIGDDELDELQSTLNKLIATLQSSTTESS